MHILFLLISLTAGAAESKWLEKSLDQVLQNESLTFRTKKGFHFSPEAPQRCGSGTFLGKIEIGKYLQCQFKVPGPTVAVLNICDDGGKTCRPIEVAVAVGGDVKTAAYLQPPVEDKGVTDGPLPGYVTGSVAAVRQEAARRGQPVFVVISTDWCWPCQMAKELVLTTPEFMERTKHWFKVYVDGDQFIGKEWQKLTLSNGFPTLAMFNPKLELVSVQFGGYRDGIRKWEGQVARWSDDPLYKLEARMRERWSGAKLRKLKDLFNSPQSLAEDDERFGFWVRNSEVAQELKDLEKANIKVSGTKALEIRLSEIEWLEEIDTPPSAEKIELLKKVSVLKIGDSRWTYYLKELCRVELKSCRLTPADMEKHLSGLRAAAVDEVDWAFDAGSAHAGFSGVLKMLGDKAGAKLHANKCREGYDRLQASSPRWKNSRVVNQHIIFCLNAGGDDEQALALLKGLVQRDPGNIHFLQDLVDTLRKRKKGQEAIVWLDKLDKMGTPADRMLNRVARAEIYILLKKKQQAKEILNSVLAEVKIAPYQDSIEQQVVSQARYHLKQL